MIDIGAYTAHAPPLWFSVEPLQQTLVMNVFGPAFTKARG